MKKINIKLNDVAVRVCVFFVLFGLFSAINPQGHAIFAVAFN